MQGSAPSLNPLADVSDEGVADCTRGRVRSPTDLWKAIAISEVAGALQRIRLRGQRLELFVCNNGLFRQNQRQTMKLIKHARWQFFPFSMGMAIATATVTLFGANSTNDTPGGRSIARPPWTDKSTHKAGFITVNGVKLNWLDWGGTGEVLLFFSGWGCIGWLSLDDLAPRFTNQFHCIAFTRRGYGQSGKPKTGYDPATCMEEVHGFMDAEVASARNARGLLLRRLPYDASCPPSTRPC